MKTLKPSAIYIRSCIISSDVYFAEPLKYVSEIYSDFDRAFCLSCATHWEFSREKFAFSNRRKCSIGGDLRDFNEVKMALRENFPNYTSEGSFSGGLSPFTHCSSFDLLFTMVFALICKSEENKNISRIREKNA